jgi:chromate reductase
MTQGINVLGIPGSLRKASWNKSLLAAAARLAPAGSAIEIFELDGIPPFNQDDERNPPPRVAALKAKAKAADAILFVTPEYNYSIPGVLKNAIDWASRPYGDSAWNGKPVAVMGASGGNIGTARAQYHLRQTFVFLDMDPVNQPEVMLNATKSLDEQGNLTDDKAKELIGRLLENLVAKAKKRQG